VFRRAVICVLPTTLLATYLPACTGTASPDNSGDQQVDGGACGSDTDCLDDESCVEGQCARVVPEPDYCGERSAEFDLLLARVEQEGDADEIPEDELCRVANLLLEMLHARCPDADDSVVHPPHGDESDGQDLRGRVLERMRTTCFAVNETVDFDLAGGLEIHQVVAGLEDRASGVGIFDLQGKIAIGGTLAIEPGAISVVPARNEAGELDPPGPQESPEVAEMCSEEPLIINVWVAPADSIKTLFDDGDAYTAVATLDEQCDATRVEVTPGELAESTLDLVGEEKFAVGVGVLAPISGTVIVDGLSFELRLRAD
jgi:hypothetical protein